MGCIRANRWKSWILWGVLRARARFRRQWCSKLSSLYLFGTLSVFCWRCKSFFLDLSLANYSRSIGFLLKLADFLFLVLLVCSRYNKTLLGDHLGKFPLPLMMNTVHFGMQAVLSNAIVFLQSKCCGNSSRSLTMTWKDYFLRGINSSYFFSNLYDVYPQSVLILLQLCRRLWGLHWI